MTSLEHDHLAAAQRELEQREAALLCESRATAWNIKQLEAAVDEQRVIVERLQESMQRMEEQA